MAEGNPIIPHIGIPVAGDLAIGARWPFVRSTAISIGDDATAENGGIAIGYKSKAGKGGCAIGEAVQAGDHQFIIGPWNIGTLVTQGYDGSMAGLGFSCNWSGCCCDKY